MNSIDFYNEVDALIKHFSISDSEIKLPTPDNYNDEFKIFNRPIEVVTYRVAYQNERDLIGSEIVKFITKDRIGMYRQLASSEYYFRWL